MNKIAVISILVLSILFCIGLLCNLAFQGQNNGLYNLDYTYDKLTNMKMDDPFLSAK